MEGQGMNTAPGAASLGQPPEREEGDFRISEEELRYEELQGSIDVIIEDWKSPEFRWWASTPEGQVAIALIYEVGGKIGEFRQRMNRPNPAHAPNLEPGVDHGAAQNAAAVADENAALKAQLAAAQAALEEAQAADTETNPAGYDPAAQPEETAPPAPDVEATHGEQTAEPIEAENEAKVAAQPTPPETTE